MAVTSMKQLLEAGVHFGHQTKRWNPKWQSTSTLQETIFTLSICRSRLKGGGSIRFHSSGCTRRQRHPFRRYEKQAQDAIQSEAERCGMYYINQRWLGGTLTNFKTIKSRIDRLNKLNQMEIVGEFDLLPKKKLSVSKPNAINLKRTSAASKHA